MWLHPLMNPCQFPACSRQLPMQRAPSPPAPPPCLPLTPMCSFCAAHSRFTALAAWRLCIFACPSLSPSLFHSRSLSFSLLGTLCIVHCLLSTVRCLFAVCLFANATRFTLVPGLVFGSVPPHSQPLPGPRYCLISTNDVLQWHGRNLCRRCSCCCLLCTDPVGFPGKKVARMLTAAAHVICPKGSSIYSYIHTPVHILVILNHFEKLLSHKRSLRLE